MSWAPGLPVITEQDHQSWQQWRKDRKRQQQRERRAKYPRIDYYPSDEASALIRGLSSNTVGGDFSSVLNRIVSEWAARCHRNKQR